MATPQIPGPTPPAIASRLPKPPTQGSATQDYLLPPLQFGSWTGAAGVVAGIAGSIARETSPVRGGFVSGAQWFTLGGTFWFSRMMTIKALGQQEDQLKPFDKLQASTIAGSITGALSGALRGPAKILPSTLLYGVIGLVGQGIGYRWQASKNAPKDDSGGFMRTWSPLKKLTDEEYLDMMNDKILKVEVDIALIDEKIADLRQRERAQQDMPQPPTKRP
ncbi:hypothetical protein VHEMI06403 [[Torrubiella] hemipterigena]|uniref:Beta-ketoacyl synthase n=1 Tax=[Torrubiella] hemipterigena TaxID=1531966 RepID=A0A0A1TJ24_9HYPO|nr:hypothetical protein VHEMI06403 [[Torrubiella] hemipterigena]